MDNGTMGYGKGADRKVKEQKLSISSPRLEGGEGHGTRGRSTRSGGRVLRQEVDGRDHVFFTQGLCVRI